MSNREIPTSDRFAKKYVKAESGCWEWTGAKKPQGYGNFMWSKGRFCNAHRASWRLHRGEIPAGLCVLHRCDNPRCVNPEHLFLGTVQDNMVDMIQKGRAQGHVAGGGQRSPVAKITDAQVREIRAARAAGESLVSIAARHGISDSYACHLAKGRWRKGADSIATNQSTDAAAVPSAATT